MKIKIFKRLAMSFALIILMAALFTGCVPGDGSYPATDPAGFFSGVWHGWIAPVTLIISIFDKNIGIYEVNNTGLLYNVGFYIAIISGFGSISLFRNRKKSE